MTSISTPPSALANPNSNASPAKLEPPNTLDSDEENEIDVALGPSASTCFPTNALRPSLSAPSIGIQSVHSASPVRSASGPSFGHGFTFGGRLAMGSVKGKGRVLDSFDMLDASPSSVKPKASSIWSTGTGSGGSTGTPERSPRKREHGDRRTPIETDAHKEQQNRTFSTALASEMFPHAPFMPSSSPGSVSGIGIKRRRSPSPAPSTPSRQRILGFSTPGSTPGSVVSDLGLLDASHPLIRRMPCEGEPTRCLQFHESTGVGLGSCVYLWSAESSKVVKLCDLGNVNPVTSVNWVQKGSTVAIGTQNGEILIYDATTLQKQRTLTGHASRVGALAWSNYTLSSGSRDRTILNFDVRLPPASATVSKLAGHRQEICGLKWSCPSDEFVRDPVMLASGGNDNKLFVWDMRHPTPLWKFHEHIAAVKAIAWSPHQSGLLASGGGTADKKIRFWNTSVGVGISEMDTGSQHTRLLVDSATKPSLHLEIPVPVARGDLVRTRSSSTLPRNEPDRDTIVTGAGDETLRFWNAFRNEAKLSEGREKEKEHWTRAERFDSPFRSRGGAFSRLKKLGAKGAGLCGYDFYGVTVRFFTLRWRVGIRSAHSGFEYDPQSTSKRHPIVHSRPEIILNPVFKLTLRPVRVRTMSHHLALSHTTRATFAIIPWMVSDSKTIEGTLSYEDIRCISGAARAIAEVVVRRLVVEFKSLKPGEADEVVVAIFKSDDDVEAMVTTVSDGNWQSF
ncbi:Cell cycle regulatory protein [Rhizoctonia solani]|uniref:Cell cycle regulatory protein n=1 Tax=Rhizoctonia solani TaxID=456999 RepID=A0A8H7IFD9_9AGAM|nr:Cell cycle regulatory protein [Rhizoctonia solani]